MIDTRAGKGSVKTDHAEDVTYSNLWAGDADATATVSINGEVVKTATDEGVYRWPLPSKGGNYVFTHTTTKDGAQVGDTLTATFVVASHEIEIDDGTDGAGGKDSRFSYSGVYDGEGHGIAVEVTSVANPLIMYAFAKTGPYSKSLLLTNACDATAVWYTVAVPGYNTYTNWATVTISPRPVTLTSGTKTDFVYDCAAHGFSVLIKSENPDAWFVEDEGITTSNWATVTTVAEGQVANTFDYAPIEGTDLANYEISVVTGKIGVVKGSLGPDGGGEPGEGDVPDDGLSKFDAAAVVYNGEGHTIDTNALVKAFKAAMAGAGEIKVFYGCAAAGATATGQETGGNLTSGADAAMGAEDVAEWREIAPAFTNAGEYVVWYRVTNPNYEDFTHAAKVTISPRPVTLTSGTKIDFVYDGTAHEFSVLIKSESPDAWFVAGEGITTSNWATVTTVAQGQVDNTFDYAPIEGTDLANYEISVVTGKIAVVKARFPGQETGGAGISWSVAADAAMWMYDGKPHGVTLTGVPSGVTARLSGNTATDAGNYRATVAFDYDNANYEAPVAPAPLDWSITPRPLTLMAASKEKPYDGFPLSVKANDITASGSGYADGECLDYFDFASIIDVGETAATFGYRDSATAKASNYDVSVVEGQTLKVTVGGDQISVTAASATWVYDGEEHRAASWTTFNGDKLLAGHELRVAIGEASVVRTPKDGPNGDGVVTNGFVSVKIVETATGADRTRNYNLVLKEGVLTMTNASVRAERLSGAADVAKTYDGETATVAVGAELLQPARVRYWAEAGGHAGRVTLPADGAWGDEALQFTHATNAVVWFVVSADYYNDYTGRVAVTVSPRPITLTTPTKTKPYDGAPLTFGADEVVVGGDGFADGESFAYSDFAAITDAGRIAAKCAYAADAGTALSDYAVTEEWGTLTVSASADEIAVTAADGAWAFDGEAHVLHAYTAENADTLQAGDELVVEFAPESVVRTPEDGPAGDGVVTNAIASVRVVRNGAEDVTRNYSIAAYPGLLRMTKAAVTFDGEGSVDPSAFSTTATYDGEGHTAAVVAPTLLTAPVTVKYGDVADAVTLDEPPSFTNAGVHTVFYTISAPYYETFAGTTTVTIGQRPVTLVSEGAEKIYDGTPLRRDVVRVKEGSLGFAAGEGFSAACTGAQTDAGAMENLFDYALTGGALADNYVITKEYGWLRVTPATLDAEAVFAGNGTDAEGRVVCAPVYNGAAQPFVLAVDFDEPYRITYALVPNDESAYSEIAPTRTHVAEGDLAVYFKFASPNYAPYYGIGVLCITPKTLTAEMCVADEDAAWFYDGTEKKPAVTVVDGSPSIATEDDYTLAYSGRTGAGFFPVTVTGRNDYAGTVTKEFAILKRPVAPPAIGALAYNGKVRTPTVPADSRWEVVSNPGGTEAGAYTNVVLRLTAPEDYRWKGLGEDEAEWVGVFEIRPASNGWTVAPGQDGWTEGDEPPEPRLGRPRYGTVTEILYRTRGAAVETATVERPARAGFYTVRFVVAATGNYAGTYRDVDFEICRADGGTATVTTPAPVPYDWLAPYLGKFGDGDYESAGNAEGANGVALWESYVAGLDPEDAASRFEASISLCGDGLPVVTWSPDLSAAETPRTYTTYGKPSLDAAEWAEVTDANRARMRFFKVTVEIK